MSFFFGQNINVRRRTDGRVSGFLFVPLLAPIKPCLYPLDDDGTVAAMLGLNYLPMLAPEFQKFDYTDGTAQVAGISLLAAPAAVKFLNYQTAAKITPGRTTAVQLKTNREPTFREWVSLVIYKFNQAGTVTGSARVGSEYQGGLLSGLRQLNSGAYEPLGPLPGGINSNMAIYVNGSTGAVGWTFNGIDQGPIGGFSVGVSERFGFLIIIDDTVINSGGVSGELITQAADITEPIPGIGQDLAGNLI